MQEVKIAQPLFARDQARQGRYKAEKDAVLALEVLMVQGGLRQCQGENSC